MEFISSYITSMKNEHVKQWLKYHQKKYRDRDGVFLVEGEHLIEEALQATMLETLLIREGKENVFKDVMNCYVVSDEIIDALSKTVSKVDYIGVVKVHPIIKDKSDRILLLDDIQDPGNLGTLIRSAYSFGFTTIYLGQHCVDAYNDKVIRSTQGALFHVQIERVHLEAIIRQLKSEAYTIYATTLTNAKPLREAQTCDKMALVLGNEGSGVSNEILKLSNQLIKIEMLQFESLNVGVAGSICMYMFRKEDTNV